MASVNVRLHSATIIGNCIVVLYCLNHTIKPTIFPRYVNAKSNHPPSMLKEIPKSVSKRISSNSCNEQVFNAAAPFYNDILDKCGYSEKLTFEKEQYTQERRTRERNIIWYNPPFSENVKTNIAKQFLHLLDKHFGRNHKYHKIFNLQCQS